MIVRATTPEDFDDVTMILEASYPALMPPGYEPAVLEAVLPFMTKANPVLLSSGSYFVAVADGDRYAGCGGWTKERPGTGEREEGLGHIRHFATHPDHTRKGVAQAIFRTCEAQARSEKIERFECYSSLNAERFYRSLGFETVERIDVVMGSGRELPSLRMLRTL